MNVNESESHFEWVSRFVIKKYSNRRVGRSWGDTAVDRSSLQKAIDIVVLSLISRDWKNIYFILDKLSFLFLNDNIFDPASFEPHSLIVF